MAHATTMTHAPAFATGSYSSTPLGLGSSAPLMPSIAPKKGASGLRRKHTMAKFGKGKGGKARGDVTTNALLEVALAAVLNNANVVAENVSNEVSCGLHSCGSSRRGCVTSRWGRGWRALAGDGEAIPHCSHCVRHTPQSNKTGRLPGHDAGPNAPRDGLPHRGARCRFDRCLRAAAAAATTRPAAAPENPTLTQITQQTKKTKKGV